MHMRARCFCKIVFFLLLTSVLRGRARRAHGRNVAVGAAAGDHRVRVLHRLPRRLRVPERHLRTDRQRGSELSSR
jgi:hypothetical protein